MQRFRSLLSFVCLLVALGIVGQAFGSDNVGAPLSEKMEERLGRMNSFALVIGISDFDGTGWNDLPWVEEEVRRATLALQAAGFQVEPRPFDGRMTRGEMIEAIQTFVAAHDKPEYRLVLYIATHGHASRETDPNGLGFLVTSDTTPLGPSFEQSAYSVGELARALGKVEARHVFVFVNACFSGAMIPLANRSGSVSELLSSKPTGLTSETVAWVEALLEKRVRLILTAGSDRQTVPDNNNPFGNSFASGLLGAADDDGDGMIMGLELAAHIRAHVARESRRAGRPNDPVFANLPFDDSNEPRMESDFVFLSPVGPRERGADDTSGSNALLEAQTHALVSRSAKTFVECPTCPVMVEFEHAGRPVALSRTEITVDDWDACYREFGCSRYFADQDAEQGNMPLRGVTWEDALDFQQWLDSKKAGKCERYFIPTEPLWRAAALVEPDWKYSWGNEFLENRASCWGCGQGQNGRRPMPVASFPGNSNGYYDMTGNVWEWVRRPSDNCNREAFRLREGECPIGTVIGGSFATRWNQIDTGKIASIPRTRSPSQGDPSRRAYSLETVGLRMACALRPN